MGHGCHDKGFAGILIENGQVFTFALCFIAMFMTRYGYGRHFDLIADQPSTITTFLKLVFAAELLYIIALNTIKISFCLLYMHIFVPSRVLRALCIALIVLLIMECLEEIIVVLLQCQPLEKAWDITDSIPGHCLNMTVFYYVSFGIKLATDIAIFVLPIPPLLRLQVRGLQKFGVILMFSLGLLVCVVSIVRVTYIKNFSPDHTWILVAPLNWSAVEICVAIFISCLPSIRSLIAFNWPTRSRVASGARDSSSGTDSLSSRIRTFFLGRGKEADHDHRQMSPNEVARDEIALSERHVRTVESGSSDLVG